MFAKLLCYRYLYRVVELESIRSKLFLAKLLVQLRLTVFIIGFSSCFWFN